MKTILVVDDNPDVIDSLKIGFEDSTQDYRIMSAENGPRCLELLKDTIKPDIILLDIMMPEMSGWEVFDRIKKDSSLSTIPIIFLTARTDRIAKNAGSFLGDDYIEKPFDIANLKKRIEMVLRNKKSNNDVLKGRT
ncbi:MAG: response regulator [Candidatus Thermoplasmatota archaeon]|nr:response regulator [Candidatus Thermoplasmatota archaeon]